MKNTAEFKFPIDIIKVYKKAGKKEEAEDTSEWYVEGLASTTDFDLSGDIIEETAYRNAETDLTLNSTVLENHDTNKRIGKVVACKAQEDGLWVKVLISKTVKDIWQQIKEGVLNKFSIRGRVEKAVKRYVKDLGRVANVIQEMYLMECSLVSLPANPQAKTLGWYISKSLEEFEKKGGEIPMEKVKKKVEKKIEEKIKSEVKKDFSLEVLASTLDSMKDRLSAEDKNTISEMVESIKSTKKEDKAPYGYPYPKKKDESNEDYHARIEKDFEDFVRAQNEKKANEEVAKEETSKPAEEVKEEDSKPAKEVAKEETSKPAEEAVKKEGEVEKKDAPTETSKKESDTYSKEAIATLVADAVENAKKDLLSKIEDVKKKNEDLTKTNTDLEIDRKVDEEWSKIGSSYKEEDTNLIKGILKKTFSGESLKPAEQRTLIEKKVSSSLVVGDTGVNFNKKLELTSEKEQEIINFSGIKTRVKE